jgi:hypothetical protein
MTSTPESRISFLERRRSLLQMLARELMECRPAYVALNLEQIHKHLFLQEALCERLRELEQECPEALSWFAAACRAQQEAGRVPECGGRADALLQEARRLGQVLAENVSAEMEVRRLNAVHGGLVNGTRATLKALARSFQMRQPIYSHPGRSPRLDAPDGAER